MRADRTSMIHPEGGRLMTKQAQALETDINQIVARHVAHGVPFPVDGRAGYGDFSGAVDYHGSLNAVLEAQREFAQLPAAVRDHCKNDPGEFLDLVYDPARQAELVELGLVPAAIPVGAPGAEVAVPGPAPAPGPESGGTPPATPPG